MTTNKPEVVAYVDLHRGHGRRYVSLRRGVDHYTLSDGDQLIRLTDYEALQAECEKLRSIISDLKDWDCDVRAGFLSIPLDLRRRMQESIDAAMETTK